MRSMVPAKKNKQKMETFDYFVGLTVNTTIEFLTHSDFVWWENLFLLHLNDEVVEYSIRGKYRHSSFLLPYRL